MGSLFDAIWDELAQRNGLQRTAAEGLTGDCKGLRVQLVTRVQQDTSFDGRIVTTERVFVSARFNAHLPAGLHLRSRGTLAVAPIAEPTAPAVRVSIPERDRAWHIHCFDADRARDFLSFGKVGNNLGRFLKRHQMALVSAEGATVAIDPWNADSRTLQALLDDAVGLVSAVEADLRWYPSKAPAFQPTRRHRFPDTPEDSPVATESVPPHRRSTSALASAAAERIAELAAGGVRVDSGRFTVDRETARRKLLESGFVASERYVLELIQAAVLKGARHIAITEDQHVRIYWEGRPFTLTDCEQLYANLFGDATDGDAAARQHLAFGLHQALAHEKRAVQVVSGDGAQAVKLSLEPQEPDGYAPLPTGGAPLPIGTDILIKRRLFRYGSGPDSRLQAALREGCRSAQTPITLNGRPISEPQPPPDLFGRVELQADGVSGWCGFSPRVAPGSEVSLIRNDVRIARLTGLPDATPGLVAQVDGPRFRLDLSRQQVVPDDELLRAMAAVYEAERRAVVSLGTALQAGDTPLPSSFAEPVLKARLRSYTDVTDLLPGGDGEPLAIVPLWHTTANTQRSLAAILEHADRHGHVPYADFTLEQIGVGHPRAQEAGWSPQTILWLNWTTYPSDTAFLVHLFGDRLRSVSDTLLALRDTE